MSFIIVISKEIKLKNIFPLLFGRLLLCKLDIQINVPKIELNVISITRVINVTIIIIIMTLEYSFFY